MAGEGLEILNSRMKAGGYGFCRSGHCIDNARPQRYLVRRALRTRVITVLLRNARIDWPTIDCQHLSTGLGVGVPHSGVDSIRVPTSMVYNRSDLVH